MQPYSDGDRAQSQVIDGLCVYFRAVGCARFSPIESALVAILLTGGWIKPRLVLGSLKTLPVELSPSKLAPMLGFAREAIQRALRGLRKGNVILETDEGLWRLNPRWREWMNENGALRVKETCYPFIRQGYPLPHDCDATPPLNGCDRSVTPPLTDPSQGVTDRSQVAAQAFAAQDISPPVTDRSQAPDCGVTDRSHPLSGESPIGHTAAPPEATLRSAGAPAEEYYPFIVLSSEEYIKNSESEYIYGCNEKSSDNAVGEYIPAGARESDAGDNDAPCIHIYTKSETLPAPPGESPQLRQDATLPPGGVIPPSGGQSSRGGAFSTPTGDPGADPELTPEFIADVMSARDGSYRGPILPDPGVILRARKLASMRWPLNDNIRDGVYKWRFVFPSEWILKALKRTAIKRPECANFAYIYQTLKSWDYSKATDGGPEDEFDDQLNYKQVPRVLPLHGTASAQPTDEEREAERRRLKGLMKQYYSEAFEERAV